MEDTPLPEPQEPETYAFDPTPHVPNSTLPALVYRSVLPVPEATPAGSNPHDDPAALGVRAALERHHWLHGGVFKAYPSHHFHSVTHECYAVFRGSATTLLGVGPLDDRSKGVEVVLGAGDVIVLPAGVAHSNIHSRDDYTYMGVYPEHAPKYDNNFCRADERETAAKAKVAWSVPVPEWDPVFGRGGPLCRIWGERLKPAS